MKGQNKSRSRKNFRARLMNQLIEEGYPDYALALRGFKKVALLPEDTNVIGMTNYESIYLNPHLNDDELSLVTRHEILHVLLNHNKRRPDINQRRRWNIAADIELSNLYTAADTKMIQASELLKNGVSVARFPEYKDKIAEEIYQMLDEQEEDQNDSSTGRPKLSDTLADLGNMLGGQEKLQQKLKKAIQKGKQNLSPVLQKMIQNGQIVQIIDLSSEDACNVAGIFSPEKKSVEVPKFMDDVHLRYSLRAYFIRQRQVDKGRSYKRQNKKYIGTPILMKGRSNVYKPSKTLAVYVDQSGSMTAEKIRQALAAVESIESLKRVSIIKHYFDTQIHQFFCPGGEQIMKRSFGTLNRINTRVSQSLLMIRNTT